MKKILLVFLLALTLIGCEKTIEYPEMDYHSFVEYFLDSPEEQLSQEEDVYYIYFYQDGCTACTGIKNEALYTIENLNTDTVYFCKISTYSDLHDEIYNESQTYDGKFGTPFIVKIENNHLTEMAVGDQDVLDVLHGLS